MGMRLTFGVTASMRLLFIWISEVRDLSGWRKNEILILCRYAREGGSVICKGLHSRLAERRVV